MRVAVLLIIDDDRDDEPADVRRRVVEALEGAGMGVETAGPAHIRHGAAMTYELSVRSDAQRRAAASAREPAESPQETPGPAEPTQGAEADDELSERSSAGRRRRGRMPRPGDVYEELGLETRPAGRPKPERKPPPGGRGTTAHSAPPMRSPRAEGLDVPDRERLRDGSGRGLGVVGQSPFDD